MTIHTDSPEATRAVAEALGELLLPGDLVLLVGDLGGQDRVRRTRPRARRRGPVTSPTFTIVQEYDGRLPLTHVDVLPPRTSGPHDLGFDELVDDGVTVRRVGRPLVTKVPRSI
jgi:tRNA threonylcarbamoyladenosine biosynthesis protein TsaE